MKIVCIIPSRMGSTRLTRKPLSLIQGKPMIEWVYTGASRCSIFHEVAVATDSLEIMDLIKSLGGKAYLTAPELPTGSDRVAWVTKRHYPDADVILNLQGDEPFIQPAMLEVLAAPYLAGENPDMTTLAFPLNDETDYLNPDKVKVITDKQGYALYFSRAPIPYFRSQKVKVPVYHHMGLYAFRRDFLMRYTKLPQTPLEQAELLEQLRALEHGYKIKVCLTQGKTIEINTPEELALAQHFKPTDLEHVII
jgi:3-deoxy-manno-octulosonate cytidylyltransferase (CMP-KDO synthetase)